MTNQERYRTKEGRLLNIWQCVYHRCIGKKFLLGTKSAKPGFDKTKLGYIGKPYESRDAFVKWALGREDFNTLFEAWKDAGFPSWSTSPSIDRWPNADGGYTFDNMRFITYTENMRLASQRARESRAK